jgi:hypothetical protein
MSLLSLFPSAIPTNDNAVSTDFKGAACYLKPVAYQGHIIAKFNDRNGLHDGELPNCNRFKG